MSEVCAGRSADQPPRPAVVCARLLHALESTEGRRRSRKRDQTPDGVGIAAKRELLEAAVRDDPGEAAFEAWLLGYVSRIPSGAANSAASAMARAVYDEWRLAHRMQAFADWLDVGAPSEDSKGARDLAR